MHTILIVDDYESVLRSLEYVLQARGYRVITATSGSSALARMANDTAHAALVDVMMPGMDGIQTCTALLELTRARGQSLGIWLMSGAPNPKVEMRAREIGAVALLAKPFNFDRFLADVEGWLANARSIDK